MRSRWYGFLVCSILWISALCCGALAQSAPAAGESSSHLKHPSARASHSNPGLEAGAVSDSVYINKSLGLTCKVPVGWVLRTEEMNAADEHDNAEKEPSPQRTQGNTEGKQSGRVLLAAFSRPPEAHGEEVNSSIVIAAESMAEYSGLKEAVQYFGPLTEVTKAQGFDVVEAPYEFTAGNKTLVRGDFQKDVGTRVMRQSTLVMLAKGFAVSITFIGGTEDEVERLVDGLKITVTDKSSR
jgi:hypothetical protein